MAAVHVDILAVEIQWVGGELDLVSKVVVEVKRRQGKLSPQETLLEAGFEGAVLFRLEIRIGIGRKHTRDAERFFEARLLDSLGVAEAQAGSGQDVAAAQGEESQRQRAERRGRRSFRCARNAGRQSRKSVRE